MTTSAIDVTFIVVTRNEEKYIERCLRSILAQKSEGFTSEIILVDGQSTDATIKLARTVLDANSVPYTILPNPKLTLATGWNIGIRHAKGHYLIRPDAHATLHPEYTQTGLRAFKSVSPEPGVVGGRLQTLAGSWLGEIISAALSSRFGVGNSSFRTSDTAAFADTAVYGIYKRSVFDSVGFFDEILVRHQDTAFHHKLHRNGIRMYFNPSMKAIYFCRETLSGIARQMYLNGYHLSDLIRMGIPNAIQPRHMAPFLFFSSILISILSGLLLHLPLLYFGASLLFGSYLGFLFSVSIPVCYNKRSLKYLLMAPVITVMHVSYALGSIRGLLKSLYRAKTKP